jgi:hypothetical protein
MAGQTGITRAQIALEALRRAGRNLAVGSLVATMESLNNFTDFYGNHYSFSLNSDVAATGLNWLGGVGLT